MRRVLLAPLLVFAVVATGAFAYVTTTLRGTAATLEREVETVRRANILASRLSQLSAETLQSVHAYLARPSAAERSRIEALAAETQRRIDELSRIDLSPRGAAIWQQFLAAREVRIRERERLVAAFDRGDAAQVAVQLDRWALATDKTTALTGDLTVFDLKRLAAVTAQLQETRARVQRWLVALLGAAAVAIVAFAWLVDRWLVRPVRAITRTARRIADQRVALASPEAARTDELGVLASAVGEMAREFVRANAELARSVETRDEFLSLAAHELRTPLAALKLHLQGCHRAWVHRRRVPTPACLEQALRRTARIETLIADLLVLAEIRTGRFRVQPRPTDLSALVARVAARLEPVFASAGSRLDRVISPAVACRCDAPLMDRVVATLLANAAEHAPGTPVAVRLRPDGAAHVLEVEDAGPGIPPDEAARVFEPYRKADRTERVRGLGLGLFITKQVVEAHGGTVALEPGARGGTRVRIALPAEARRDVVETVRPP